MTPVTITSLLEMSLDTSAGPSAAGDALAVVSEVLGATRAFPGCLGCDVLVDAADPSHVVVVETWESLEHDDAYRAWRATPEGASRLHEVLAEPARLTRWTTAEGV
jgi:quinol monooxygenase YgiN